nr:MAG TPA: hypothetical protein [Crassvirales sp.]
MIGTHDSYTFLPARSKLLEWFSFLWRTQVKNIAQQKEIGVSYFDIRVRRDGDIWRVCHGLVDFDLTFDSIEDIVNLYSLYKIRVILERGNCEDKFREEVLRSKSCPALSFACIKKKWKVLLNRDPNIFDYTYIPWLSDISFLDNIRRLGFFSTIKKWAKKHNPIISSSMIKNDNVYFMDYV